MKTNIPKIIHYVWVGKKEKNDLAKHCIESFKKFCPEYEIMEWNEDNFDVDAHPQVKKALEEKNWAYASDIIRVWALYQYGGIYLDTDLELTKPLDDLLDYDMFLCYESKYWFGTAVLAAKKHHEVLKKIYARYDHENKITFNTNPLTVHAFTAVLRKYYGLKPNGKKQVLDNILLLPEDYFFPINYMTLKKKITNHTYGIHYYGTSWHNKSQKAGTSIAKVSRKLLGKHIFSIFEKIVGNSFYKKLKKEFNELERKGKINGLYYTDN
ncbi:predicted glycosyltransferase, DXD sugar-binding region [Alteracholeplasma palmae J233]|uniref:Predicted glycosyltransferase, DXD sugar-binding region n=1 Tax=Alteracholeplasma palmae (strain ATCC 49389 / J233) TaxID=1318466 RepID=U4KK73_ALTPJ|nr:glycosyltransferase [Alteracholeplasma palmae]CCV63932.1 predicted glycosyltransferase, DXD sugar-binding region [Alteracholeplasma palmae J233]